MEPPPPARAICRIGKLILDPRNDVLLRDGVPLPLGRRAVALLKCLVRAPGAVVGKDTLLDAAWPGLSIEESNLTVQISKLRRSLRAAASGDADAIETLPGRGYRFTGSAVWEPAAPPAGSLSGVAGAPATAALSNIPITVPLHFTGRAAEFAALRAALDDAARLPAIVVLHGMRGVGKTILAAAYARARERVHRATWWLRAETVSTLRADLAALAVRLGWARPEANEATAFAAALDGLRDDGDNLLLIYDNAVGAAALRDYLPKGGGARIIVTSNARAWRAHATPLEISIWPAAVGAAYLTARTGRDGERADAEALSAMLDGLPLAHEQAGAYIENLEIPVAEYMRRFTAAPARLLDDPAHAPADYHDGLTVAKAFDLAIAQAAALHPACRNLLQVAALLAPEPIPVFLFREGREALGETLATQLAGDGLDTALAALRNFALISREMVPDERDPALRTDCLRLHRLVRQVAVAGLSRDAVAEGAKTLIAALAAVYPRGVYNNVRERPQARRLDALALPLVAPPAAIPSGAERTACVLLDGLASFRHAHAAFGVARPLFERAHALARQVAGRDDKMTAQTLNNLALLLRDHGDPAAAQNLFTEALAIRETMFGPDHPEVAVSLNNLGNAFSDQGDHGAARPCFERALAIWERAYGASDPMTARAMNNLARQLHFLGDLGAARPLMERALAARETCLGPFHRDTANSLQNLALVRLDLGDVEAARELFERALRVADEAVGAAHPDTAGIRAYMARCLLAAGAREQALALAERALADLLAALAPGAPITRMAATVSAACLDALGQAGDAARLRQRHSLPPPSG